MAKQAKENKYVYYFGGKKAEGQADMKNLLGGKGANLAEMVNIGLPVPAGFTITTEVCTYYQQNKKSYPKELKKQLADSMKATEKEMGAIFGDKKKSTPGIRPLRRSRFDARDDGDRVECWFERHHPRRFYQENRKPPVCV